MTPALKAMVEAMAAEFVQQAHDVEASYADGRLTIVGVNGEDFDLEKVARAGLEAIGAASEFQALAMSRAFREWDGTGGELRAYQEIWAAGVTHTLGLLGD